MRWLIAGCFFFLAGSGLRVAGADESHYSKAEVRKELVALVESQLAAFRADDFARAYTMASAPLRVRFPLKEFMAMIKQGYPLIAHSERAELGLPMDDGTTATLPVRVFGPGGQSANFRYTLVREAEGWRVNGVMPEKPRPPDI